MAFCKLLSISHASFIDIDVVVKSWYSERVTLMQPLGEVKAHFLHLSESYMLFSLVGCPWGGGAVLCLARKAKCTAGCAPVPSWAAHPRCLCPSLAARCVKVGRGRRAVCVIAFRPVTGIPLAKYEPFIITSVMWTPAKFEAHNCRTPVICVKAFCVDVPSV